MPACAAQYCTSPQQQAVCRKALAGLNTLTSMVLSLQAAPVGSRLILTSSCGGPECVEVGRAQSQGRGRQAHLPAGREWEAGPAPRSRAQPVASRPVQNQVHSQPDAEPRLLGMSLCTSRPLSVSLSDSSSSSLSLSFPHPPPPYVLACMRACMHCWMYVPHIKLCVSHSLCPLLH